MNESTFPLRLGEDGVMVRFSKVTKRYGDLTVLDSLDLDVSANEMVFDHRSPQAPERRLCSAC